MVTYSDDIPLAPRSEHLREKLARIRSGLAEGGRMFATAGAMQREIDRLKTKSDAELAAMGLTRDAIVRHVYKDELSAR